MTGHDLAGDHGSAVDEFERCPDWKLEKNAGIFSVGSQQSGPQPTQAGHLTAIIETGLEGQSPLRSAGQRLEHSDEPERFRRLQLLALQRDRHEVDDPHAGMLERPDGLNHIRVAPVLTEHAGVRVRGSELEKSAPIPVEQPTEHPGAVEARQAHPVDRALLADQRRRAQVADQSIIPDRRIPDVVAGQSDSRNTARPTPKPMRPSTPTSVRSWIVTRTVWSSSAMMNKTRPLSRNFVAKVSCSAGLVSSAPIVAFTLQRTNPPAIRRSTGTRTWIASST